MKDAYAVLQQKEGELARIRHEIEGLQIVAPLLSDEVPFDDSTETASSAEGVPSMVSEATGTEGPSSGTSVPRGKFWKILKRGKLRVNNSVIENGLFAVDCGNVQPPSAWRILILNVLNMLRLSVQPLHPYFWDFLLSIFLGLKACNLSK